jgi:hypothetical protein
MRLDRCYWSVLIAEASLCGGQPYVADTCALQGNVLFPPFQLKASDDMCVVHHRVVRLLVNWATTAAWLNPGWTSIDESVSQ